jgi:hypothetical protein
MTENFPGGGGYLAEAKAGSLTPDGQAGTGASNCNTGNYPLSGWVVNTRKGVGGATSVMLVITKCPSPNIKTLPTATMPPSGHQALATTTSSEN